MKNRTNCAVILAAGLGERFLPITKTIPKPAIPFLNKPMIHWTMDQLINYGIEKVFVNLHHLPDVIIEILLPYKKRIDLNFSFEENILGTYGLFSKIRKLLPEKFFVVNSDIFLEMPLSKLDNFFNEKENLDALLLLRKKKKNETYTSFSLEDHIIKKMGQGSFHFCGIYIARKNFLRFAEKEKKIELLDILKEELRENLLGGIVFRKEWLDLGTPEMYLKSTKTCLKKMAEKKMEVPECSHLMTRDGFYVLAHKDSHISKKIKLDGFAVLGKKSRLVTTKSKGNLVFLEKAVLNLPQKIRNAIVFENGILLAKMDKNKNSG